MLLSAIVPEAIAILEFIDWEIHKEPVQVVLCLEETGVWGLVPSFLSSEWQLAYLFLCSFIFSPINGGR